jgi:hypothetical protein
MITASHSFCKKIGQAGEGNEVTEKMNKFYEGDASFGIPSNIHDYVHSLFTKIYVEYSCDNKVRVFVPKDEDELIDQFNSDLNELLLQLKQKNSALAQKLARYHRSNL